MSKITAVSDKSEDKLTGLHLFKRAFQLYINISVTPDKIKHYELILWSVVQFLCYHKCNEKT